MQSYRHYVNASHSPTYAHDCAECVFVGSFQDPRNDELRTDVWMCPEQNTLVQRMSDAGPEYMSFPLDIARLLRENTATETIWSIAVQLLDSVVEAGDEITESPDLSRVKISRHPGTTEDESGESGYSMIFVTHDDVPTEILDEVVRERYPSTHCQHEHDCCGRAYSRNARRTFYRDDYAIYRQDWHLNI